jgi:predicted PurR-regulated permease PerM
LASAFILPIVIALVLALALHPGIRFLQRFKIPKQIGAAFLLLATLTGIGIGVAQIYEPAMEWLAKAPSSLSEVQYRMREWIRPVQEVTEAAEEVQKITEPASTSENQQVEIKKPSLKNVLFQGTQSLVGYTVVIVFLLYFLLASGDTLLMNWIDTIFRPLNSEISVSIVRETEYAISQYLLTVTLINVGLGLVMGCVMSLLGMPSPFLWGAMATVFNFIPYVGAVAGMIVVGIVAILSLEPASKALMAPVVYIMINGLEGLMITPVILGRRFALNPVVIFVWLIFMGWIWGIPGALLAVPILTILKIVCDYSKNLKAVGRIIGRNQSDEAKE